MKRSRKKYSLEFKISSVKMSIQYDSVLLVSQELNISKDLLHRLKKLYIDGKLTLRKPSTSDIKIKEELLRLGRELKEIKIERDILKKALNIFSKNGR